MHFSLKCLVLSDVCLTHRIISSLGVGFLIPLSSGHKKLPREVHWNRLRERPNQDKQDPCIYELLAHASDYCLPTHSSPSPCTPPALGNGGLQCILTFNVRNHGSGVAQATRQLGDAVAQ